MPNGTMRAIFRAAIPDFIAKGYSANAMIREAKAWGVSYRRTDMLGDVRDFQGFFVGESRVRELDRDITPSSWYMQETYLPKVARYRVWANEHWTDRYTGEERTATISMYSDTLMSLDEYESEYLDKQAEDPSDPTKENRYLEFRAIQHQEGWSY